jgi:hypothetical protein
VKVKLQEVIDALTHPAWADCSRDDLANRIEQHGIEIEYTPMTDDEIENWLDSNPNCELSDFEMFVASRFGVAPSLDHSSTVSDVTERLVNTTEREEAMNAERLRKAKQICEQAGYAVVPKDPTPEMLEAGNVALIRIKQDPTPSVFNRAFYTYEAMLEAAKEVKP